MSAALSAEQVAEVTAAIRNSVPVIR
jgi:hypothetical protein